MEAVMYNAIVARRVRTAWSHLNDRDIEFVLRMFAPTFTHRFVGQNAMGGVRDNIDSRRRWFERLFRLLTDIRFTVDDVLVKGWPWRTRVVALLRTSGTVAGHPFNNEFAQTIELRWGQITRVNVVEDTEKMATILGHLIECGVEEASAPQITDRPDPRDLDNYLPNPR
ncbi:nuclear transport factor 2 family protein [Nonomuraea angiospora]|uniref:nuclear transport factor 2 family protein n=1 Tax=Nonomuraea angiospora TaxID=46172 RepID=UPI00332F1AA9